MKQVTNWAIDVEGRLIGDITIDNRSVRTTAVMSRNDNIVVTKTGSQYELVDPPHPLMDEQVFRNRFYGKTESAFDALDFIILQTNQRIEQRENQE